MNEHDDRARGHVCPVCGQVHRGSEQSCLSPQLDDEHRAGQRRVVRLSVAESVERNKRRFAKTLKRFE